MSDDLTTARGFLRPPPGMESVEGYAAAAAYAAVDAAETLRRVESLLETSAILRDPEMMAKIDRGEADIAAGRTSTLAEVRERLADAPAPDAPATPQVGEVWEDPRGRRWQISEVTRHANVWVCRAGGWPPLHIDPANGWRRVSPAPAPLTEREVTAEAEAQGVEPASDDYAQALDELTSRALDAEARAENAEAQVALMRPVVEAAQEYEATHSRDEREARGCALICPAVRAYREATRGE